jgi:Ca2+-binding EF-hand superfamily protein
MKKTIILTAILGAAAIGAAAYAKGPDGDHFSRFDEDGDGKVAVSELDARHKEMLAEADKDGDGYVTKDEMKALHESHMAGHKARMFPDANNDGKVTRREFEDAARDHFNKLDKDGDGLLTTEEMEEHHGMRGHH